MPSSHSARPLLSPFLKWLLGQLRYAGEVRFQGGISQPPLVRFWSAITNAKDYWHSQHSISTSPVHVSGSLRPASRLSSRPRAWFPAPSVPSPASMSDSRLPKQPFQLLCPLWASQAHPATVPSQHASPWFVFAGHSMCECQRLLTIHWFSVILLASVFIDGSRGPYLKGVL